MNFTDTVLLVLIAYTHPQNEIKFFSEMNAITPVQIISALIHMVTDTK